jgi:hypothetical protein
MPMGSPAQDAKESPLLAEASVDEALHFALDFSRTPTRPW